MTVISLLLQNYENPVISDGIASDQALVRPLVEASAAKYTQAKGITPWSCP